MKTAMPDFEQDVNRNVDVYFARTREIAERFGDAEVTYAVFIRRPVICAPRLAVQFIEQAMASRGFRAKIELPYQEGEKVGAGEPFMYVTGPLSKLVDLETQILQRLGSACVAAYNAATMCESLPHVAFIDMGARHCAGGEMVDVMSYGAAVGSARARNRVGAIGFIGNSTDRAAPLFGQDKGLGTMPHALIGYAGSTVRAAEMFHETYPDQNLTVLVDYFGQEVTDSLAVARRFPALAAAGRLAVRLDTTGARYLEGLNKARSYEVLNRHVPEALRDHYLDDQELSFMIGEGVTAAAIWRVREALNEAGFDKVKIVASSGFGPAKCKVMALTRAPIDVVGTGSFIPERWSETYATADIISYNGTPRVKASREYLLRLAENN